MPEATDRSVFEMTRRDDGVIVIRWLPHRVAGAGEAREATTAMTALTGARPAPLLVDARAMGHYDRSAREEFARRSDLALAIALLVDSPLSRMMADFFVATMRSTVPVSVFEDEGEALAWLAGFTT